MHTRTTMLAALAAAVLLAACGGGAAAPDDTASNGGAGSTTTAPATTSPPTTPPATVLLTIEDVGGFAPIEWLVTRTPRYVLLSDGTLYSQGAVPAIYPGPALAPIVVSDVSAGVDDVLARIDEVGLPDLTEEVNDDAADTVADAATTVATYYDAAGAHRYAVYGIGAATATDERVRALEALLRTLDELVAAADGSSLEEGPLQLVLAAAPMPTEGPEDVRPWPLAITPDDFDQEIADLPCTVLEGEAAAAATEAFGDATQVTAWDLDGTTHGLLARHLLPGEPGCAPLGAGVGEGGF